MNILLLCDEYPPGLHGGIGSATKLLAEHLVLLGHRVIVAGLYPAIRLKERQHYTANGVEVWKIPYSASLQPLLQLLSKKYLNHLPAGYIARQFKAYNQFLNQLIADYQIDIVEIPDFQEVFFNTLSRSLAYQLSAPYVVKTHGSYAYLASLRQQRMPAALLRKEQQLFNQAKAIIAPSAFSKQQVLNLYGLPTDKVQVIYNGVAIDATLPANGVSSKSVVFCGSLVEGKGIFDLIRAWNLVHAQAPSLVLDVFGKYQPAIYQQLQQELQSGARASVQFHGHVAKEVINQYYANAMVTVLPSYFETFGMTAAEAMSQGSPVIFTERATGPELITDGVTGILVNPQDHQQIAGQILKLSRNEQQRQALAQAGRASVAERFAIEKIAAAHVQFYSSIL